MKSEAAIFVLVLAFASGFAAENAPKFDYCKNSTWYQYGDFCYRIKHPWDVRVSWHDAEDYCLSQGAHLVSIHSAEEHDFLMNVIEDSRNHGNRIWIGLNIFAGKDKYHWSDGSTADYLKIVPKTLYRKESCFMLFRSSDGWRQEHCSLNNTFICKRPNIGVPPSPLPPLTTTLPQGNCPFGWLLFGQKCYKYFGAIEKEKKKWKDAKNACIALGEDYDLVSIHNMKEQAFLTQYLSKIKTSAYIGFSYISSDEIGHEMVFGWSDNSRTDFTFWAPGHPIRGAMKYCAVLNYEGVGKGEWISDYCEIHPKGYICQRPSDDSFYPETIPPSICGEGFVDYKKTCYELVSTPKTWQQANQTCQERGGHLVFLSDSFEQAFLYNLVIGKVEFLWNGLRTVEGTRIFRWSDKEPFYFSNWHEGQPILPQYQSANCVHMSVTNNLQWNVTGCEGEFPFVCKNCNSTLPSVPADIHGTCPPNESDWIDIGDNYCYHLGEDKYDRLHWGDNSRYCTSKGLEMVTIQSQHQMNLLMTYLWKKRYDYWLGLIRKFDSNDFVWSDGSPLNFTNWAEGEPSAWSRNYKYDCVSLSSRDTKWNPTRCDEWLGAICRAGKTRNAFTSVAHMETQPIQMASGADLTPSKEQESSVGVIATVATAIICAFVAVAFVVYAVAVYRKHQRHVEHLGRFAVRHFDNYAYKPSETQEVERQRDPEAVTKY